MNPEALNAFNNITNCISSPHIKASVDTMLHNFLKANGNPRPQQSIAKSPSSLSRMLNEYNLPALALIRESRALIKQKIWLYFSSSKKRRPRLELIIDMTTLEKTDEFKELPLSFFNEKYGLHLVVLYVVIGNQRFIWAIRIWEGKDTRTWVDHALSTLRCTPAWFKDRFKYRVLADTGFGTILEPNQIVTNGNMNQHGVHSFLTIPSADHNLKMLLCGIGQDFVIHVCIRGAPGFERLENL